MSSQEAHEALQNLISQAINHAILANQALRRAIWETESPLTTSQAFLITELVAISPRSYQPHIGIHERPVDITQRIAAIIALLDQDSVPVPDFLRADHPRPSAMFPYRTSGTPPPSEQ